MNYILFDGPQRTALLPLTFTRPVADLRIGIWTIREKWERFLGTTTTTITEDYLSDKYPMVEMEQNVLINASFLPNAVLAEMVRELGPKQAIIQGDHLIAFHTDNTQEEVHLDQYECLEFTDQTLTVMQLWDLFEKNDQALREDYEILTEGRVSQPVSPTVTVLGNALFVEEGAKLECVTLNTTTGPIYIGKNAEIMEGSVIRGPFALCDEAQVKLSTKIYGATTIGPHCRVGGEVNNSVLMGYSNKGHDGFLGNAVLGEWCNIGADSNNSNLKNNYEAVKLWSYETERFEKTGLQFCGLVMGDHSKCGINTMFNTGTVVGVSANVFGSGFPRNFVPDFSWGGASGFTTYSLDKALETARIVMSRRKVDLSDQDKAILQAVFEQTQGYRK